jgi:glutaredoxin-related protein
MQKGGLASYIPSTEVMLPMRIKIGQMIRKGDIMIFMNGSMDVPQCVKSKTIVEILKDEKYSFVKDGIASFDLT